MYILRYLKTLAFYIIILPFTIGQNNVNYDCPTSSYENSEKFIAYYQTNKLDSAGWVLTDWENKCGYREIIYRAQTLLEFTNNRHPLYTEDHLFSLIEFIQRDTISGINQKIYYEYNRPHYTYIPINEHFDQFTKSQFQKLNIRTSPEEELVRSLYAGGNYQDFYTSLKSKELKGSQLQSSYLRQVDNLLKIVDIHYSLFTGIWLPLKNSTLGPKPEIGFQLGWKKSKWNYDLTILFRFLKSQNNYKVYREQTNQNLMTNHFFGGYIGIDCGYDIYTQGSNEIQVFGGFGYDGFDSLKADGDINAVSVGSLNVNLGLKYRKYINTNAYLGFNAKYNAVNYSQSNKVDFNEYPVSLNIVYGYLFNRIKDLQLKSLNHTLRQ